MRKIREKDVEEEKTVQDDLCENDKSKIFSRLQYLFE